FWVAGPYNLIGFDKVFHSALRENYDKSVTAEEADEVYNHVITIGPFANFSTTKSDRVSEGMGLNITIDSQKYDVVMLRISGKMKLAEFLQKVYIYSFVMQYEYGFFDTNKDAINKLKRMYQNWIDDCVNSKYIFDILSGYKISNLKQIDEEYAEEKKTKNNTRIEHGLHTTRHKKIIELIPAETQQIIDLGCGSGQLLKHLELAENQVYIGLDSSPKVGKVRRKENKIRALQTNILFPYITNFDYTKHTTVILSEVIEHMDVQDRQHLYDVIEEFYRPDVIILTTPNREYNHIWDMEENEKRHKGHQIEFDSKTVLEVHDGLWAYSWEEHAILDTAIQPSFAFKYTRKFEKRKYTGTVALLNQVYNEDHRTNIKINDGLCSNNVVRNIDNLFYLGPTISPAESDTVELESLNEAVRYYEQHGVDEIVFQTKEMGSRGYVLWFSTTGLANNYGFENRLVINSRNGFPFFDDELLFNEILKEFDTILSNGPSMVILDAEITPWCYKASGLIDKEFTTPLTSELMSSTPFTAQHLQVLNALDELKKFSANTPIKINVFDVIVWNEVNMMEVDIFVSLSLLNNLLPEKRRFLEVVTTSNDIRRIPHDGTEGIVVKPRFRKEGVLPALKVRSPEFLKLIYGAHYESYIEMLSKRPTNKKRKVSYNQWTLSKKIVDAFLETDIIKLVKYIGLFNSADRIKQDATL
ncbi:MAG: methyltransferase domain-containing protein, partial [Ignavibacteriae bacterium]|nr:methyltransferase domain-containing protein [Ignavibacteriota bacterium]